MKHLFGLMFLLLFSAPVFAQQLVAQVHRQLFSTFFLNDRYLDSLPKSLIRSAFCFRVGSCDYVDGFFRQFTTIPEPHEPTLKRING